MLSRYKTTLRNWTILLGSTMTIMAGATISPALPEMMRAFQDVPNAEFLVKLTLTIPALLIAITAPFFGFLLDRWGRKPVLIVSVLLYGFAGVSGYVLDSLIAILIGRAFLGLAVAGVMSGFTTLIADYFSGEERNQFMGYQASAMGFGGVVFLLFGGMLADIGWRFPFLIYLFAFIILPGVIFAVDEPELEQESKLDRDSKAIAALPIKKLALICGIGFLTMLVFFVIPVQLPFFLVILVSVTGSQMGIAFAAQSLVGALMSLQFHRFKARFSYEEITVFSFVTLGIGSLLIGLAPGFGMVVAGLLVGGVGIGLQMPVLSLWLVSEVPVSVRGMAVGALTAALYLGQFLSPIAAEPLIQAGGFASMFAISGALALLLAAGLFGFQLSRKRGG